MKKLVVLCCLFGIVLIAHVACERQPLPKLEKFALSHILLMLKCGESATLQVKEILPEGYKLKSLQWKSSNSDIAMVSEFGKVEALSVGETIITATSETVSATCKLTVEGVEVESIMLDREDLTLEIGETYQLRATIIPDNTGGNLVWSSADGKIASVSSEGEVKAFSVGETKIKATSSSGKTSATCTVSVIEETYAALSKLHLPFIEWGKSIVDVRKYEAENGGTETGMALYDDFEETYCFSFSVNPNYDIPIVYRGYITSNKAGDKLSRAIITFPLETIMRVLPNGGGEIRSEFTKLMKEEGFEEFSFPLPGVVRTYANKARNLLIQLNIVTFSETGTKQFSSFTIIPYDSLF